MTHKKAFTLIELLVVISIITMLISVLMPMLITAREQARLVVDKDNLHQIGLELFVYAENNKGYIPPDKMDSLDSLDSLWCNVRHLCKPQGHVTGFGLLEPVYKADASQPVQKILVCPSDRYLANWYNKQSLTSGMYGELDATPPLHAGQTSYANFIMPLTTPVLSAAGTIIYNRNPVGFRARDKVGLPDAARSVISMCTWRHGRLAKDADNKTTTVVNRPHENAGVLFLDGHVGTASFSKYAATVRKSIKTYPIPPDSQFNPQLRTGGSFDSRGNNFDTTTWVEGIDAIGG